MIFSVWYWRKQCDQDMQRQCWFICIYISMAKLNLPIQLLLYPAFPSRFLIGLHASCTYASKRAAFFFSAIQRTHTHTQSIIKLSVKKILQSIDCHFLHSTLLVITIVIEMKWVKRNERNATTDCHTCLLCNGLNQYHHKYKLSICELFDNFSFFFHFFRV